MRPPRMRPCNDIAALQLRVHDKRDQIAVPPPRTNAFMNDLGSRERGISEILGNPDTRERGNRNFVNR